MPRNDRELTRACLAGDPRAWDEFVERYGRLIYSIPRRLGLCEMDSEDVLQTVLGIALRRLETLRDVERLSAWLIRTTYRESWRYAKRTRKHAELDENVADDQAPPPSKAKSGSDNILFIKPWRGRTSGAAGSSRRFSSRRTLATSKSPTNSGCALGVSDPHGPAA